MSASQMSIDDYKQTITNYSLDNCKRGNQGYERVLLQLFGLLGNGKSSFINSCKFVIDGDYKEHTNVEERKKKITEQGGHTRLRAAYKLTDVIMLVDNRGCGKLDLAETGQIYAQIGNLLPLNKEVEWVADYEMNVERLLEEDKKANYTDFVVPIFVHSVRNVIPRNEIASYKEILKTASLLTGINPLVLLTHKSHGGLTAQEAAFRDMGADRIYSIENYTNIDHQQMLGKHEAILKLLCQVLKEVDFCMERERDPRSERNDRMAFILKYIKKADDQERDRREEQRREREERERREREERERREREERERREREERERRERERRERERREREERERREREERERREREERERHEREEREKREKENKCKPS